MYTTLNMIRECHPCRDGWTTLLEFLDKTRPDDEPLSLLTVLESNGLEDAVWCLRAVDGYDREKRAFMAERARKQEKFFSSPIYSDFLTVVEAYGRGEISEEEFVEAKKQVCQHEAQHGYCYDDGTGPITDYLVNWAFAGNTQGLDSGVMVWHVACRASDGLYEDIDMLNSKLIQLIGM